TGSDRPSGSQIAIDDLAGNRLGLAAPTAGGIRAEAGDPRKMQIDRTVLVARPRHISGNTIDLIAESAAAKARDDSSILEIVVQHGHSLPLSNREQPGAKRVNLVILCGGNAAACPISSQASSIDTTYHNTTHKNGYVARHIAVLGSALRVPRPSRRPGKDLMVGRCRAVAVREAAGAWPLRVAPRRGWRRALVASSALDAA